MTDYIDLAQAAGEKNPYYPFEALFYRLEACGLNVKRPHDHAVQELRNAHGLYDVTISHSTRVRAEYIHITKPIAEVLAAFLKDPRLGDISVPYVSGIDADAKPVLEAAIKQYKGLGAGFGFRSLNHKDDNTSVTEWFSRIFAESDNPNLIGASFGTSALLTKRANNQRDAEGIIEAIKSPEKIDRALCELAAERMPLILYTVKERNEHKERWQSNGDFKALLRLQAAAQGYGIKIDVPRAFRDSVQLAANSEEIKKDGSWTNVVDRSWTALPTVERKGCIKKSVPAKVIKNDGERFYNDTPIDQFMRNREWRDGIVIRNAQDAGEYPPQPRSR